MAADDRLPTNHSALAKIEFGRTNEFIGDFQTGDKIPAAGHASLTTTELRKEHNAESEDRTSGDTATEAEVTEASSATSPNANVAQGGNGKGSEVTDMSAMESANADTRVPTDDDDDKTSTNVEKSTTASTFDYPDTVVKMQYSLDDKYQLTSYGDEVGNRFFGWRLSASRDLVSSLRIRACLEGYHCLSAPSDVFWVSKVTVPIGSGKYF